MNHTHIKGVKGGGGTYLSNALYLPVFYRKVGPDNPFILVSIIFFIFILSLFPYHIIFIVRFISLYIII